MKNRLFKKGSSGVLVLTALCMSMGQVSAEEYLPSINYFEAGYLDVEIDNFLGSNLTKTNDLQGVYADGRFALLPNFYLTLGIKTTRSYSPDFDFTRNFGNTTVNSKGTIENEFDEQRLGFGYVTEPSDNWRLTADINYLRQRYTVDRTGNVTVTGDINDVPSELRNISDSEVTLDGGLLRLGTEYAASSKLTFLGNVTYQNISGDGFKLKGYRLNLGANYKLSDDWSLTGNYQISNENALYLGVRYSF